MDKHPCVYILSNGKNGTLYVGVTPDLIQRVWQHKNEVIPGFTARYHIHDLVWYEPHATMESAIQCEKGIEDWTRYPRTYVRGP